MADMKVKDLIKLLREIDGELPVYKYNGIGEFKVIDIEDAGNWMNYEMLMRSKNDPTYVASVRDPVWRKARDQFGEAFKAVRFW